MPVAVKGLTGVLLEKTLEPGSPEWLTAGISSSRVAAIAGVTKGAWASRFTIWHQMAGNLSYNPTETDVQRRGRLLEPCIAQWWIEEHPQWDVRPTGTWTHPDNPRHIGSPDRLATHRESDEIRLVECKSALTDDEYGVEGTDEIPEGYRVQALWQLHTTGADICHVPVFGKFMEFSEYIVTREGNEDRIAELAQMTDDFLATLPGGSDYRLPPIDGSEATFAAVKKMHPKIVEGKVEMDPELIQGWVHARNEADRWKGQVRAHAGEIIDRLGPFRDAVVGDHRVAYRKGVRGGGTSLTIDSGGARKALASTFNAAGKDEG